MAKKNAYFFCHDSNARSDEKILAVRMKHKAEGYGVYFMLIEMLTEEPTHSLPRDYDLIAFELRVDAPIVKAIVEDFGLFQNTDNGRFYSPSLINRMQSMEELSSKRSKAAKKRWENSKCNANAIDDESKYNANAIDDESKYNANAGKNDADYTILNYTKQKTSASRARVSESENEEKKDETPDYVVKPIDELYGELKTYLTTDTQYALSAENAFKCSRAEIIKGLDAFQDHLRLNGCTHKTLSDYRHHFNNWYTIQCDKKTSKKNNNERNSTDRLHVTKTSTPYYTDF